jgi:hypothetical protein
VLLRIKIEVAGGIGHDFGSDNIFEQENSYYEILLH